MTQPPATALPEIEFPPARDLAQMPTHGLLALFEQHEQMAEHGSPLASAAVACIDRIATALAHRLGIHCDEYIRVMREGATAVEWRALFGD
jgi:hypothetical protein